MENKQCSSKIPDIPLECGEPIYDPNQITEVHYYPETGKVFDKKGNFLGMGEMKGNHLTITRIPEI